MELSALCAPFEPSARGRAGDDSGVYQLRKRLSLAERKETGRKTVQTVGRCLFFEVSLEKGEDLLIYGETTEPAADLPLSPYVENQQDYP